MKRAPVKTKSSGNKRRTTMAKATTLKMPNLKKTMKQLSSVSPKTDSQQFYQRVQEKAYELYEQRGCLSGNDLADWFTAESLVKGEGK